MISVWTVSGIDSEIDPAALTDWRMDALDPLGNDFYIQEAASDTVYGSEAGKFQLAFICYYGLFRPSSHTSSFP